jgi:hypothetical protein
MTPSAMTSAGRRVAEARTGSPTATARGGASPARASAAAAPRAARASAAPRPVRAAAAAPRTARASAVAPRPARAAAAAPRPATRPSRGSGTHAPRPARSTLNRPPRRVSGPVRTSRRPDAQNPLPRRLAVGAVEFVRALPDHRLIDRLVRGRAWIPVLGVLLAGIVATQVEVLKLGASTGRWINRSAGLTSRNQLLQSSVAALSDDQRIERLAARMGMTMPAPTAITFLSRHSAGGAATKVRQIQSPDPTQFLATLQADGVASSAATISSGTATAAVGTTDSTSSGTTVAVTAPPGTTSTSTGG